MKHSTANKYDIKAQTSVLIVDDDYRIRDLLKSFLKKSGYFSILAQKDYFLTKSNFVHISFEK